MSELAECEKCNQSYFVPDDYEAPEHGLCWPCSSETVSTLKAALEESRKLCSGINKSAVMIREGSDKRIRVLERLVHLLATTLEDAKGETIDNYEAEKLLAKGEFYNDINDALHEYYEWFKTSRRSKDRTLPHYSDKLAEACMNAPDSEKERFPKETRPTEQEATENLLDALLEDERMTTGSWFHLGHNFFFTRDESGTVHIKYDEDSGGVDFKGNIPNVSVDVDSFASAVASCSKRGDNAKTHAEVVEVLNKSE